jgi:hypothetical protein
MGKSKPFSVPLSIVNLIILSATLLTSALMKENPEDGDGECEIKDFWLPLPYLLFREADRVFIDRELFVVSESHDRAWRTSVLWVTCDSISILL